MVKDICFTREALMFASAPQLDAIRRLVGADHRIEVMKGGFDLPTAYLMFTLYYLQGGSIHGGIAPDGSVST